MGKLIKSDTGMITLPELIKNIDIKKFDIPITEEILKKNGWETTIHDEKKVWYPVLPMIYDEKIGDWVDQDEEFDECYIWYRIHKEAWCYRFNFGTYVYNIKSIGELEIILAREGFYYEFDI